jgi:hypothetical protein
MFSSSSARCIVLRPGTDYGMVAREFLTGVHRAAESAAGWGQPATRRETRYGHAERLPCCLVYVNPNSGESLVTGERIGPFPAMGAAAYSRCAAVFDCRIEENAWAVDA